jgi:hypothetical protein
MSLTIVFYDCPNQFASAFSIPALIFFTSLLFPHVRNVVKCSGKIKYVLPSFQQPITTQVSYEEAATRISMVPKKKWKRTRHIFICQVL